MSPLELAVVKRSEQWQKNTDEIFNKMDGVISGITSYLECDEELSQCDIVWRGITFLIDQVEILSTLTYPVDSVFIDDSGDTIKVTESTKDYFNRPVTMYFPLDMIIRNNPKEIHDFLHVLAKDQQDITDSIQTAASATTTVESDAAALEKKNIAILLQAKNPTGILH